MEAIASRLEAVIIRLEAIATKVEAIPIRVEAIASRLDCFTYKLIKKYVLCFFVFSTDQTLGLLRRVISACGCLWGFGRVPFRLFSFSRMLLQFIGLGLNLLTTTRQNAF